MKQTEGFYRAFWVQAFEPGLKTSEEIDQLLLDADKANMNAILTQVSRRSMSCLLLSNAQANDPCLRISKKVHGEEL